MSMQDDFKEAIHSISEGVDKMHQENLSLKRRLDDMEKRAIEWEQMHLDQCEINKRLQKELEEANAVIRDQIERNQTSVGAVMMKKYDKVMSEERAFLREQAAEDARKRDEHNAAVQANIKLQSQIMQENLVLYRINTERNKAHDEVILRSVIASEKQTLLLENISQCLSEITDRDRIK